MRPVVFRMDAELDAPPQQVWELITDWKRQSEWMVEMSDILLTSDHREGVGVTAEATIKAGGIRTRDVVRVDVWDPPRHLGLVHEGWVGGRGDIRLAPLPGSRTGLAWKEELHPPWGLLGAIGLRAFRPLLARVFRRDVRILQALIRARV